MQVLKGHALRKGRYSESGRIYLVTTCCFERRTHFRRDQAAILVMEELRRQGQVGDCLSLAYVVMPDHAHWLVQLTGSTGLSKIVGRLKGRTSYLLGRSNPSLGRIWQSGFHDHALRTEEDLADIGNYLIHNPVRAGIVDDVDKYSYWDSIWHRRYLMGRG